MVRQINKIPNKAAILKAREIRANKANNVMRYGTVNKPLSTVDKINNRVKDYNPSKVPDAFYILFMLLFVGSLLTYVFSGTKPTVDLESFLNMLSKVHNFDLKPIMKAMTIDTPFDWLDNILNIFTGIGKIAVIFTAGIGNVLEIIFYFLKYLITGA